MQKFLGRSWLAALFGIVLAVACVQEGKHPGPSASWSANDLQGHWEARCVSDFQGRKLDFSADFTLDTFSGTFVGYSDSNCTQALGAMSFPKSKFRIGADLPGKPGEKEFDIVLDDGQTLFTKIKVEGTHLYTGMGTGSDDGLSATTRHSSLNPFSLMKK